MREAIDYNALSWIRQEVGVTLKQARLELEEFAESEPRKELLQGCAAYLHEARGPLRMVNIRGADLLACEMEEAIADLLLDSAIDRETLLEQLMQGFLELPEYLANLRPGKVEKPKLLLPLVNSLRAARGLQPVNIDEEFTPDLSASMPVSEYDPHARRMNQDVAALARTARIRFQSGLLEWYRDAGSDHGLQILVDVLEQLQESAHTEPAARVWWIAAGVAELLRDGEIEAGAAVKRLFGQLDRQIKRLMDSGETIFADVLSEDLVKNLLHKMRGINTDSRRVNLIRATYGLQVPATEPVDEGADHEGISDELLQTVSRTAQEDVELIKEQLDGLQRNPSDDEQVVRAVADRLHSLGNTLGMIGMDRLAARLSTEEMQLRDRASSGVEVTEPDYSKLANTMIAIEDALSDMASHSDPGSVAEDRGESVLRQGRLAVVSAVIADIGSAKDAINEFLNSSGNFDLLNAVPDLLHKICGGLELAGEGKLAVISRQVGSFVSNELIGMHRQLSESELDSLADAICSIEYCVEELGESHEYGERPINVAMESLEKLGYTDPGVCRATGAEPEDDNPESEVASLVEQADAEELVADVSKEYTATESGHEEAVVEQSGGEWQQNCVGGDEQVDTRLQVIAPDADAEIVEIFMEESSEVLDKLSVDIPSWIANPDEGDALSEIRRAFHTIKGSGRMIGAMAAGEMAWAFENLLNRVIEGSVPADAAIYDAVGNSLPVMKDLVAQVANPEMVLLTDVPALARYVQELAQPGAMPGVQLQDLSLSVEVDAESEDGGSGEVSEVANSAMEVYGQDIESEVTVLAEDVATMSVASSMEEAAVTDAQMHWTGVSPDMSAGESGPHADSGLPVLKQDADPEIVEIFLEEAGEELAVISLKIPEWIQGPDDGELLGDIRRSMHTLKGSGRMAGAMLAGEFAWSVEMLLNRIIDGNVRPDSALFAFLSRVPEAFAGLLRQLEDGGYPQADIAGMMRTAEKLSNGADAEEDTGYVETGAAVISEQNADESPEEDDEDAVLMELYTAECREHLENLGVVSEASDEEGYLLSYAQYRALHTLTGISESAEVPGIGRLAAALYSYFGNLYNEKRPLLPEALDVLDTCAGEMRAQLERLPDRRYDEELVGRLITLIAQLPVAAPQVADDSADESDVFAAPESAEVGYEDTLEEIPEIPLAILPVQEATDIALDPGHSDDTVTEEPLVRICDNAQESVEVVDTPSDVGTEEVRSGQEDDIYSAMDQELYEIFVEEAIEIIDSSETVLRNWTETPDDLELLSEFQRLLHTLKGGARMVDIVAIGNLSHALESLLTLVTEGVLQTGDELFALLQEAHDRLAEMMEKVKARAAIAPATDLEFRLESFRRGEIPAPLAATQDTAQSSEMTQDFRSNEMPAVVAGAGVWRGVETAEEDGGGHDYPNETDHAGFDEDDGDSARLLQAGVGQPPMVERRKDGRARSELVRVQADILDNLVNNAGEINIYRSRMEQQISNFRFNLTELDTTINRLRDQLRQLEIETEAQILFRYEQDSESRNQDFDPLELDRYSKLQQLSRSLIESISDLRSLQGLMEATTRDSETLLLQQSRVSTDLQEGLIRTRMIPFASLAPRLRRIVRQSARQLGKKVDLNLRGAEGEMDRAVIERIVAPLEHMLRNAVAHGIENPERRKQAGKKVAGNITIEFNREGTEIVLHISDDGAGLDIDAIRNRAVERGLMDAGMVLPDSDVMQFVLQTGFSTASEVTQISGRGVGMDVVNSEVKQLGGSLHINSRTGQGSVFTIRLPYTLAINQALLITVGEQVFCAPMSSVEGIVTADVELLRACYRDNNQEFGYAGHNYQLMHLGSLLGINRMDLDNSATQIPILLVRTGEKRIGVQVDTVLGSREVVIKPLGAQLSLVDGITGATILPDGRVVMILDMFAVSRMKVREQLAVKQVGAQDDGRLVVMVVDDSITVRKVTSRLLERSGYRVMTAKDGVDAMGQLQEAVPDMMLLDIEMPRMDGFELATHMRNDERLKHVPIIMITSRTGDKHRQRAIEIGVNEYLGKPYQESELLASINNIIGIGSAAVGA